MFCILLANLRKWVKIPYNLLKVNEHFSDKQSFKDDPLSPPNLLSERVRCGGWSQMLKAEHTLRM